MDYCRVEIFRGPKIHTHTQRDTEMYCLDLSKNESESLFGFHSLLSTGGVAGDEVGLFSVGQVDAKHHRLGSASLLNYRLLH